MFEFSDVIFHFQDRWLFYVLFTLFLLLIMVGHELGHYVMARLFGMPVQGFSIGRGRVIKKWKSRHGTDWELRLWPIQGHILIADQIAYNATALWKRILVIIAGPIVNFSIPFFAFLSFFVVFGYPYAPAYIVGLEVDKPADQAGMQVGDVVLSIDGHDIKSGIELVDYTRPAADQKLHFKVLRAGTVVDLEVTPELFEFRDRDGLPWSIGYIGINTINGYWHLKNVRTVNGVEVEKDDVDRARELILALPDHRESILGLEMLDLEIHDLKFMILPEYKEHLKNSNDRYYKFFRTSPYMGNALERIGFGECLVAAYEQSWRLISNFAKVPFNMFPLDTEKLKPELSVGLNVSWIADNILRVIALGSLVSVIMGLINLLPFPGLDGYNIIINVIESLASQAHVVKMKVFVVMGAILSLYAAVIFSNLPDMGGYWSFHYQKLIEEDD